MRGITVQLLSLGQGGTWTSEDIPNVLVAPVVEVDSNVAVVHEGHRAIYHMAIPKTDNHAWEGRLVQFFGCTWSVIGIPTRGIDDLIPGPWNMKVNVELYRTATLAGQSLWVDTVTFPVQTETADAEGYISRTEGTPREVKVIFVEGVNAEDHAEADKQGMRRTATVEIWKGDYRNETQLIHDEVLYAVRKRTDSWRGSWLLTLEEVWR